MLQKWNWLAIDVLCRKEYICANILAYALLRYLENSVYKTAVVVSLIPFYMCLGFYLTCIAYKERNY